jgi:hypothetical protein
MGLIGLKRTTKARMCNLFPKFAARLLELSNPDSIISPLGIKEVRDGIWLVNSLD